MVSIRLPTVHRPISAPTHSSQPLRCSTTLCATGPITSATTGGTAASTALMVAVRSRFLAQGGKDRARR